MEEDYEQYKKDVQETVDGINAGKDPNDYPPELLFSAQCLFGKQNNLAMVKKIGLTARQRLYNKGLIKCDLFGWFRKEDVSQAGLVLKGGHWVNEDKNKLIQFFGLQEALKQKRIKDAKELKQGAMNYEK